MSLPERLITEAGSEAHAEINRIVVGWAGDTLEELKTKVPVDRSELVRSLKKKFRTDLGLIERISFAFKRHGVFVHKGVGRGWPIESAGENRKSITAAGGKGRTPNDWFNPVLLITMEKLGNKMAEQFADIALSNVDKALIK